MTRLIDADALFINLDGMMAVSPTGYIHGDTVADMINDAPTIDAVPVVHGRCDDVGCPVYYEMLNEIQCWKDKCRNYDRTVYKLSLALLERAEWKEE